MPRVTPRICPVPRVEIIVCKKADCLRPHESFECLECFNYWTSKLEIDYTVRPICIAQYRGNRRLRSNAKKRSGHRNRFTLRKARYD
ncbi:hypothetical protein PUN28_007296 [Cardiocondyla obscurior]|uniref:Uncharacterized protein n=1 Tax=Cardiocondyla obscurior TaxID=286306 RepID=A0AAW2G2R4_9HYME